MLGQIEQEIGKVRQLTDKQRQCMELVVLRKSSKEIARILGIAKPTVDQRIASARQILGARNRDEAALIFSQSQNIYDRVTYDSARVPFTPADADSFHSEVMKGHELRLEEAAIPFSGIIEHHGPEPFNFGWRPSVDSGTNSRLLMIVGLTVGLLSIVLVGLAVAEALTGLLTAS